jgi:hypothetical protein
VFAELKELCIKDGVLRRVEMPDESRVRFVNDVLGEGGEENADDFDKIEARTGVSALWRRTNVCPSKNTANCCVIPTASSSSLYWRSSPACDTAIAQQRRLSIAVTLSQ